MDYRQKWIDICKGLGIILVLLGHRLPDPDYTWFIFGFHMPLFFMLSGYLYKDVTEIRKYAIKICKRYLVPYYVFAGINLIISIFLSAASGHEIEGGFLPAFVRLVICQQTLVGCEPLWFLPALAVSLLAYTIILKVCKSFIAQSAVMVILCVLASFSEVILPFNLQSVVMAIVFIHIGHLLHIADLINRISNTPLSIPKITVHIGTLCGGAFCIWSNYALNGKRVTMNKGVYNNVILCVIGSALFSYGIFCLLNSLYKRNGEAFDNIISMVLTYLGRHTIFIVAFDQLSSRMFAIASARILSMNSWYLNFVFALFFISALYLSWRFVVIKRIPDRLEIKRLLDV